MGKDSSEIRREIEETRARMGDTVEALGYKADVPARVKDAVNERVETVKGTLGEVLGSVKDTVVGATGKVGTALGGASRTVSDTLIDTTERMGDATTNVRANVQNVQQTVGNVAGKLPGPDDVTRAARRGVGMAVENPLGLALGALAVGFVAGLIAPVTDLEREKVGPLRDQLLEKAKDLGTDALEQGKAALQQTAQAAMGAAQQAAVGAAQQVFSDAVQGQGQQSGGTSSAGTSTRYGELLEEDRKDTLRPGSPGTASP